MKGDFMEKTCYTCVWGKDGICQKPNRQPNDSMDECYVDPLEIKSIITRLDTRSWDNVPYGIQCTPPTQPITWEDNETTLHMEVGE